MYAPPWLSVQPQDFVKAAEAGANLGIKISENATRANLEMAKLSADRKGGGGGGRGGGGGGMRLPVAAPVVNPSAPYIGGIPGSPMLVDPQRENQAPVVNKPFSLPGDTSGRQFITTDAGNVDEFTPPPIPPEAIDIRGNPNQGIVGIGKTTGTVTELLPASPVPLPQEKERVYSIPILQQSKGLPVTIPMTPSQLRAALPNLSEFAKTNEVSKFVLGLDKSAAKTNEVIRVTKDGRRAVYDAATKRFLRYAE